MEGSFSVIDTARLTTIPTPDIPRYLNFPGPCLPTHDCTGLSSPETALKEAIYANDVIVLQQVAGLLHQTDITHLDLKKQSIGNIKPIGPLDHQLNASYPSVLECRTEGNKTAAQHRGASSLSGRPPANAPLQGQPHGRPGVAVCAAAVDDHQAAMELGDVSLPPTKRARTMPSAADEIPAPRSLDDQARELRSRFGRFTTSSHQAKALLTDDFESPYISAKALRSLTDDLRAKPCDCLRIIDVSAIKAVLAILHDHVKLGLSQMIGEHDNEKSDSYQCVLLSLESAITSMYILTAPDLPPQVYVDEHLEAVVGSIKYHLQYNIMVFYDLEARVRYRPSMEQGSNSAAGQRMGRSTKLVVREHMKRLTGRLVLGIGLVSDLLSAKRVEAERVLPFTRTALKCLSIDSLQQVQASVTALVVQVFKVYTDHQSALWEEFASAMQEYVQTGRIQYLYPASDDQSHNIQTVTATALQLIEASVEVPDTDATPEVVNSCFQPARKWGVTVCAFLFDRLLPEAKAQKSDTAVDYKRFVEVFILDLLRVKHLPEWPGAICLLTRILAKLVMILRPGSMRVGDPKLYDKNVQLMCIDLVGILVTNLCGDAKAQEEEEGWVREVLTVMDAEASTSDMPEVEKLQQLLLRHLAAQTSPTAALARRFLSCQSLHDHLTVLHTSKAAVNYEDVLLHFRLLQDGKVDPITANGRPLVLDSAQAAKVARALVHRGRFGSMKGHMLGLLAQAGDKSRQDVDAAKLRAKAIKGLGSAVDADIRVLGSIEVQSGVDAALRDDAVSVREAAVDLIGKYISRNQELALKYFDIVSRASQDAGITVRKRAVKIMWECCVRCPDFPKATEGIIRIMQRATDHEPVMRALVVKICNELWFTPGALVDTLSDIPIDTRTVQRSAALRAQQLAKVAFTVYVSGGGETIRLPYPTNYPLVVLVQEAMGEEGKAGQEAWNGGRQVVEELLQMIVQQQGVSTDGMSDEEAVQQLDKRLAALLALLAICEAQPSLCVNEWNPQKFVLTLAPYLPKDGTRSTERQSRPAADKTKAQAEAEKKAQACMDRRQAECLTCLVAILQHLLSRTSQLAEELRSQLRADLCGIIQTHGYVHVVRAACSCICSLSRLDPAAGPAIALLVTRQCNWLSNVLEEVLSGELKRASMVPRYLFSLGHLCRCGADVVDEAAAAAGAAAVVTCRQCLELFVRLFGKQAAFREMGGKLADHALQAMGLVFIARPDYIQTVEGCLDILKATMQPTAAAPLKRRALQNLVELLKEEEEGLHQKQADSKKTAESDHHQQVRSDQHTAQVGSGSVKALAQVNGEGDGSSVTFGVIQAVWDKVLALASDVRVHPKSLQDEALLVRRAALDLIEAVMKGGHMPPWKSARSLVCLATDPQRDVASKALKVLKTSVEKHTQLMKNELGPGVEEAFRFQKAMWEAVNAGKTFTPQGADFGAAKPALQGLSALYSVVIQPDRTLRPDFLSFLVGCFNKAACLVATGHTKLCDVQELCFLSYLLADLPYKRADEPLQVLHCINEAVSRRSADVTEALSNSLPQIEAAEATAEQEASTSTPSKSKSTSAPNHASGPPSWLTPATANQLRASLALSMLLVLKQYLRCVYNIASERIAGFTNSKRHEETRNVNRDTRQLFKLDALKLNALSCPTAALEQYKTFKGLLDQDTSDYREQAMIAEYEAGEPGENGQGMAHPSDSPEGLLLYHEARTARKTGRGSKGGGSAGRCGNEAADYHYCTDSAAASLSR